MAAISTNPTSYGAVTYLSEAPDLAELGSRQAAGDLVMFGTRDEVEGVARRLRAGHAELERRARRRAIAKASRKKNRRTP